MGIENSKPSRQATKAKTKTLDFPTRTIPTSEARKVSDHAPERIGARTTSHKQPLPPPRSSSFSRQPFNDPVDESPKELRARTRPKESSLRSCLSWDKPGTAPPPKPAMKENLAGCRYPKGTCDKCDGGHLTDDCPIYKKKRDDHPDAWRNFGRKSPLEMGKSG
jgi:hypothetical protein